jgi:hypothetical protein
MGMGELDMVASGLPAFFVRGAGGDHAPSRSLLQRVSD